ncbi:ras guanine nucleotide exchange factor i-related [Anaeramoeba flamelloides]|uniref:Ras guanine nucleotide exchange factor i-related n=1 Tax=Anaeramoeba flamelloides TaxID=1746091 RepID=A0ABQ8YV76_9EUKA|nr:ras guanine nucleotide exchange factor i-related [Anaeramoeba flamelloides]
MTQNNLRRSSSHKVVSSLGLDLKSPVRGRNSLFNSNQGGALFKRDQLFNRGENGRGRGRGRGSIRGRGRFQVSPRTRFKTSINKTVQNKNQTNINPQTDTNLQTNNKIQTKQTTQKQSITENQNQNQKQNQNQSQTKSPKQNQNIQQDLNQNLNFEKEIQKSNTSQSQNKNVQQPNNQIYTQEQELKRQQRQEEKIKREEQEKKRLDEQRKKDELKKKRKDQLKQKLEKIKSRKNSRYNSSTLSRSKMNRDLVAERMEQRSRKRFEIQSQSSPNIFFDPNKNIEIQLTKENSDPKNRPQLPPRKNSLHTNQNFNEDPNITRKSSKYGKNLKRSGSVRNKKNAWKRYQTTEKEMSLMSKIDINRTNWKERVFQQNPNILDLKERVIPISRCQSFARLYGPGKDQVREKLTNDLVLQLIMQNLITLGFRKTKKILEHEADVKYQPRFLKDSRLQKLIKNGMRDIEYVWQQTMSQQKNGEESNIGNLDIMNHFKNMGLEEDEDDEEGLTSVWDHEQNNIIYLESETSSSKTKGVKAASLNKLIELLTPETDQNIKYMKTFLMTYQSFTTPSKLLNKLMQRYHVPMTEGITEEEYKIKKQCIQIRVCNVLKTWISENFSELNRKLLDKVINFLDQTVSKLNNTMAKTIKQKILRNLELGGQDFKNSTFMTDPPEPKVPKNIFSPDLSLFDIDEEEIARQLTLFEFQIYQKIRPPELLNLAWSKAKLKYRAPNVIALIHRFNEVSSWVVTTILKSERVRERARIIVRFCKLAEHLRSLNNYNGVMSIISGFENSAIWRLKYTFEEVPKRNHEIIQELKKELSSDNSYRYYRSLLRKVDPPCIPYLGVYLTDLTFIEEGNPNFIDGLINFSKRRLIYEVIFEIQNFQNKGYNLQPVQQILSFLEKLPILDEKDVYSKSLKYEPRKAKREDILF